MANELRSLRSWWWGGGRWRRCGGEPLFICLELPVDDVVDDVVLLLLAMDALAVDMGGVADVVLGGPIPGVGLSLRRPLVAPPAAPLVPLEAADDASARAALPLVATLPLPAESAWICACNCACKHQSITSLIRRSSL